MYRFFMLLFVCLGSVGCFQTRRTEADRVAREQALQRRQQQQMLEEERRRTRLRIEDADTRLADVDAEVRRLEAELARRPGQADIQRLEERISGLERQLRQLEEQRVRDREEIVKALSDRMAQVMAAREAGQARASGRSHVVSRGETLSAIASAWEVSSQAIIRANNLSNPDNLRIGQKLIIP